MKKLLVILFVCCLIGFVATLTKAATSDVVLTKCADGFKQKTNKNYKKDYFYCYNPKTKVTYNKYYLFLDKDSVCAKNCDLNGQNCEEGYCEKITCNQGYKSQKNTIDISIGDYYWVYSCINKTNGLYYDKFENFYYDFAQKCGQSCDINGNNCKKGHCNKNICAKGYIKKGNACYSTITPQLSYQWTEKNYKQFYLNGKKCGQSCDLDGKNCIAGICHKSNCAKGFTLKTDPNITKYEAICYNSSNKLSYQKSSNGSLTIFHKNGEYCGRNCDYNGKNCKEGFCETLICPVGFQQKEFNKCYNPTTDISFDNREYFFRGETFCGNNCNPDGTNCETGDCRQNPCPAGFQRLAEACKNPTTNLIFKKTNYGKNKIFYNGILHTSTYYCGEDCDLNGRNCKKGFCNSQDCAMGYQIHNSYCLNPELSIAYDRDKKFYIYLKEYQWVGEKETFNYCGAYCDFLGQNCKVGNCSTKAKKAKNAIKNTAGAVQDAVGVGLIIPAGIIYSIIGD